MCRRFAMAAEVLRLHRNCVGATDLARSVSHLVSLGERLETKGVSLKVLDQAIDTATPTGRLMFNMLGGRA